ncbi:MAG: bifunctional diaminohydroxyphosphoribosylaminopyrimidine deaminase/5-amino-6-(5-phosphoribosylamino)uracil reductase RibD, partial [Nitrospirota bacterium]|nr:bifunctional diaminohydroxyphosphoribosylaminopyrimidine deaminase/5-amino-6-(5-phosphoribosylamino)uracil reductase RibD [Nitrospirota bacterium]
MSGVETDVHFMKQALRLAAKGRGTTSPNPMVGAILVKNGRIVGKGYHRRAGAPHAEILALQQAGSRSHGATLYVTLEPCSHTGKRTPPCVPAIITARPRRVVVAMRDPNPHVNGQGIRRLRQSGLTVDIGCLQEEAKHLNEAYVHWVKTGRPFVILKAAMTLDGKIATASGESKWITGAKARLHVHRLRSQVDGIMVGIGTVLKDDPQLTARLPEKDQLTTLRQPVRIVLDTRLRIPLSAHLLEHLKKRPTIIATTSEAPT